MDGIKKAEKEALQAATHSLTVARSVKVIMSTKSDAIEAFVLDIENGIRRVGKALGETDLPYDTLRAQLEELIGTAEAIASTAALVPELETEKEGLTASIADAGEAKAALEAQIITLEASLSELQTDNKEQGEQTLAEKQQAETLLFAEKDKALQDVTRLKRSITELEMKLHDAESKLAQAESLDATNKELQKTVGRLQSDKDRALDEIGTLKVQVSELKKEVAQRGAEGDQAISEIKEAAQQTAAPNS